MLVLIRSHQRVAAIRTLLVAVARAYDSLAAKGALPMAELIVGLDETVTVKLSVVEKLQAFRGNLTIHRRDVSNARVVPDGLAAVHGLRLPGTSIPGMLKIGTWRSRLGRTLAVCHGRQAAVVFDLSGAAFDRVVLTVDDPRKAQRLLS